MSTHTLVPELHSDDGSAGPNLLGLPADQLVEFFAQLGEKPFRARQLMQWVYGQGELDFGAMTTLSKALRGRLAHVAGLELPAIKRTAR